MTDGLLEQLETATEGSEELDVAITKHMFGYGPDDPLWHALPYSQSIDSAITLIPEGWCLALKEMRDYGWDAELRANKPVRYVSATMKADSTNTGPRAIPTLAICVVALKARQHED